MIPRSATRVVRAKRIVIRLKCKLARVKMRAQSICTLPRILSNVGCSAAKSRSGAMKIRYK